MLEEVDSLNFLSYLKKSSYKISDTSSKTNNILDKEIEDNSFSFDTELDLNLLKSKNITYYFVIDYYFNIDDLVEKNSGDNENIIYSIKIYTDNKGNYTTYNLETIS